jgi:predicted DsbA family dithiol-disulfide isomerase
MKRLTIRIVSDVICPWCFVGKRRLERALLTLSSDVEPEIVWSPFELNPDMPVEGMSRRAYRTAKFGSWERSQEMDAQLAAVGASLGIQFNFPKIQRTPNTFAAHRLIWFAGKHGKQNEIVEQLFQSYFIEGADIAERETLVAIAATCCIPEGATREFLKSDDASAEVKRESSLARDSGITGVPTFIFNDTYALAGAQPEEVLASALRGAAEVTAAR